jgi:uroporphyrinogen decarboxylase
MGLGVLESILKMTSRQRIQAALAHKQADRVPVDFNGHRSSGIHAPG